MIELKIVLMVVWMVVVAGILMDPQVHRFTNMLADWLDVQADVAVKWMRAWGLVK